MASPAARIQTDHATLREPRNMSITRAIIPCSGSGTRLRPLTKVLPKEMLPVGRKVVLQYVFEELILAGLSRFLFIISPEKEMIQTYFGDGSQWGVECSYIMETKPKGPGGSVLLGRLWANNEPFVVAFGDCILQSPETTGTESTAVTRLINAFLAERPVIAVLAEYIPSTQVSDYPVLVSALAKPVSESFSLTRGVDTPDASGKLTVAARYVFSPSIFDILYAKVEARKNDILLYKIVEDLLAGNNKDQVWAVLLRNGEQRHDIGTWENYLTFVAQAALNDIQFGERIRAFLCS